MSTKQNFSVTVFGLPEFEQQVLKRIFSLSSSRDNTYELLDAMDGAVPDIVLFDTCNASAVARMQQLAEKNSRLPAVAIIKAQPGRETYFIRRPLTATRMLGTLDQVVHKEFKDGDSRSRLVPLASVAPPQGTADAASSQARRQAPPLNRPPEAQTSAAHRALVVDDSLPVRKQVGMALERAGVAADFADNGERALELIAGKSYDIIFLDVIMPGADGYEVCKSIKRDRAKKNIPVVMLTGKSSPFDKVKGKLSGCDTYLTKPVSLGEFTQTLNKCLRQPLAFEPAAGLA